ncbi:MAG: V-type ATP synthase subunit D [Candidatus Brocadiales bacterium]|nr:V-type ATP synthase subunit D [Candidatus Bathyanammoxibius sp.]MCQ4573904.1 V-type ATP synthase subunit D [Candidatus Bathyanammoxibius amoris]
MRLKVNPNRMELLRLRRRYALALRGHRMIKDKLEGLVKEFLSLSRDYKDVRGAVDRELPELLKPFVLARLTSPKGAVTTALEHSVSALELELGHSRVLNVTLPSYNAVLPPAPRYSLLDTAGNLDTAVSRLRDYLPRILRLTELEHSVWLLAREVEETRRRVNALEYILIPELRGSIRSIKARLDEMERFNISRLMKVKEILEAKRTTF